jgi:type IV secretory pathway ATPase VirB11/archaellum biosynthesis ATPase
MRGDKFLKHYLAPIQADLDHPDVTDITINQPHEVFVRKSGVWQRKHIGSFTLDLLDALTIVIGQRTGREFDEGNPYVNSTMPGGQRFQGVRSPGTRNGRILWAIRRPPAVARTMDDPDMEDLLSEVNTGTAQRRVSANAVASAFRNKDWDAVLRGARLNGMSIGICGSTGDGKSDFGRRLVQIHRPDIRMVTLETDDEIGDAGPVNKAPLFYDDTLMSSGDALKIAKRLVPVEIVMQEVRGEEAWSLLLALNSGHAGLTSWHSNEGEEQEALADMARDHASAKSMEDGRLMEKIRRGFDVIAYAVRTDHCKSEWDKGFRISSLRLMAAEREAAA